MANKQNSVYVSGQTPKSSILKSSFISRLSSLWGFRAIDKKDASSFSDFPTKYGMEFVRVDLDNKAYRFKQAALGSVFQSQGLSQTLEKYFDAYMQETTLSYNDIQDRQRRLNELSFLYYNDNFCSRVVELVAAEATQLDVQNRILTVDSPNLAFSAKCYELFSRWGLTQQRLQQVCHDLQLYGESFWGHKIGLNGIEKVVPIRVNSVMERLEFSPVRVAEYLAQKDGYLNANKNRNQKLDTLISNIKNKTTLDYDENLADMFDTKLLGYELHDNIMAAPWEITHFRYNAENSEFYPYGRPPLLNCLAPFKQAFSSMQLQGLARSMSFPVTLYKVKGTTGMGPDMAFEHTNTVKDEYDNIGLSAASAGGEVYTVNTKIWMPAELLDVDVKESKCDIDFVGDIELYQDRVAIASGVPKAYLDQEFGGFGNSAIALTEQYKPFARHVYTIQSACLDGIGELIRLHFAITGEFDYNTPFVLSLRYPAEEMSQEKRDARTASLELVTSIMELLVGALGLEEGEPLPEDVVTDILSKYSFLDPTDIQKWMRLSYNLKPITSEEEDEGGEGGGDDFEFGSDEVGDMGTEDTGAVDLGGPDGTLEGTRYTPEEAKRMLREREERITALKYKRLKEISNRYKEASKDIYFHFLENQNLTEFTTSQKQHCYYVPKIDENNLLYDSIMALKGEKSKRLKEDATEAVYDKMTEIAMSGITKEEEQRQQEFDYFFNNIGN